MVTEITEFRSEDTESDSSEFETNVQLAMSICARGLSGSVASVPAL
jgi:hypothetical protein